MTPESAQSRLRLRTPDDVLAAAPYLLGFHPTDSLVVLGLSGTRLSFHVRGDLLELDVSPEVLGAVADGYADLFAFRDVDAVVLVGYGDRVRVTPMIQAVKRSMRQRRIDIREMLRADDGRFWSYMCHNPRCCPPEGTPYEVSSSAVAVEATIAGFVALPDRDTVVRSLAPPVGLALAAAQQAADRAEVRLLDLLRRRDVTDASRAAGQASITEACDRYASGGRLDDDEVAWLALQLHNIEVRDLAWRRIDSDGRDGWVVHERLWSDLVRRCDPQIAAPVAMLLSYTMWRCGDGLRAGIAVERALRADPGYSAARLMAEVLNRALPPSALDRERRPTRSGKRGGGRDARRHRR